MNPPIDDGLFITDVRPWSREKHHFLERYIAAFTTAMRGKNWSGLHYIDLFAGAGIERFEDTGALGWGSPLIAAKATHPFTRLHLCEWDDEKYAALRSRVGEIRPHQKDQVLQGDANVRVTEIVATIPSRSLTLAFLDPTGLHLAFDSLRVLADKRSDLIIYFPDRVDILRNWKEHYLKNLQSNLDSVLGPGSKWREKIMGTPVGQRLAMFREIYCEQIATLGYRHFGWEPIPTIGRSLYRLIFCSRAKVALKIWNGVSQIKPGGQRSFPFGDRDE